LALDPQPGTEITVRWQVPGRGDDLLQWRARLVQRLRQQRESVYSAADCVAGKRLEVHAQISATEVVFLQVTKRQFGAAFSNPSE